MHETRLRHAYDMTSVDLHDVIRVVSMSRATKLYRVNWPYGCFKKKMW